MRIRLPLQTSIFAAALLAGSSGFAATISNADYKAQKAQISADYKDAMASCDKLTDNAKDVCHEKAKGNQKVALAELAYNRSGKTGDASKLAVAKADSAYGVAKEKCDAMSGNEKDVCVKQAKADHTRATADAKMNREVSESRQDAAADKRDAAYNVAKEKCGALSGDAKTSCLTDAKARFGKS